MNKDSLLKLASKIQNIEAEIEQIKQQEPVLRADTDVKVSELAAKIPVEKLITIDPNSPELDSETAFAVRTLSGMRLRLELIPGVKTRLNNALAKANSEAADLLNDFNGYLLEAARGKIEALTQEFQEKLVPICGGDRTRTLAALKSVVANSEAQNWFRVFDMLTGNNHANPAGLRNLHRYVAAFEANKNIADVPAA